MSVGTIPDDGTLRLEVGCQFDLRSPQPTTAVLQVAPHLEQHAAVISERWDGRLAHEPYRDEFANRCARFTLPAGEVRIAFTAEVSASVFADEQDWEARETPVSELPHELLHWVLPSRFCQPDELGDDAWRMFGSVTPGWTRVQAICDFVNAHLAFVHGSSNPWTTAADAYRSGQGVCRDFAHLAITFCRALNIPARYAFGYIPDIGIAPPFEPMDFSAWFEVFLSGRWHTFDARINRPRIGRVLVGRGRDAIDVAQVTSFGAVDLLGFVVQADQLV